jgi:hypothetical protein
MSHLQHIIVYYFKCQQISLKGHLSKFLSLSRVCPTVLSGPPIFQHMLVLICNAYTIRLSGPGSTKNRKINRQTIIFVEAYMTQVFLEKIFITFTKNQE